MVFLDEGNEFHAATDGCLDHVDAVRKSGCVDE